MSCVVVNRRGAAKAGAIFVFSRFCARFFARSFRFFFVSSSSHQLFVPRCSIRCAQTSQSAYISRASTYAHRLEGSSFSCDTMNGLQTCSLESS